MSLLASFFKESDTRLGVFYPKHYVIASFPDIARARPAVAELHRIGFPEDEAIAVAGREIIELSKEETGPGSMVMQALSRFFATEQFSHDRDLDLAHSGAGFVAVHCPTEKQKDEAWQVLRKAEPLTARYYANDGIDHLAGDFTTN